MEPHSTYGEGLIEEGHNFIDNWSLDTTHFYDHAYDKSSPDYRVFGQYMLFGNLKSKFRILTYGGSTTSSLVGSKWAEYLYEILNDKSVDVSLLNGGCGGHNSWNEMNKMIRDLPTFKPTHVISFSGINDFWNQVDIANPHLNIRLLRAVLGIEKNYFEGRFHDPITSQTHSQAWKFKSKIMKCACEQVGAKFFRIIQPTLGYREYNYDLGDQTDSQLMQLMCGDEIKGLQYRNLLNKYYDELISIASSEEYIYDFTRIFEGGSRLYADHRHPNSAGYKIIAQRLSELLFP